MRNTMKNTIWFAVSMLVMVLLADAAFAQMFRARSQAKPDRTEFGIIGGLDFARFIGDDADNIDTRTFGNVGLYARFNLNDNFAVQPEFDLSVRGAKMQFTGGSTKYRLTYLRLPVMVKALAPMENGITPFVTAGPAVSLKIDDNLTNSNTANDWLFDAVFGVGVQLQGIIINGRYNLGLTDTFDNSDIQNQAFTINIGIALSRVFR